MEIFLVVYCPYQKKNEIKLELEKTKKIFNLNFRKGKQVVDILECLEPMLFANILSSLRESCPTIINVLEQSAVFKCTLKFKEDREYENESIHSSLVFSDRCQSSECQKLYPNPIWPVVHILWS